MKNTFFLISCLLVVAVFPNKLTAQANKSEKLAPANNKAETDTTFSGLEFRNIGPALMSGRIADIAIHPQNNSIWYVAVGSGGVWKTENAGITWKSIFDKQTSYSIGCITIDPLNPHVIWVGTGENVGGRHVGYGDGVYKSEDDGATWKNLGLKDSQHISKISIHPKNSNIVWVAAQGPLWNKGGDRGLYKTTDAGKTWRKVLGDSEWVGVTDMVQDPGNPDIMYAATWQRHRNVAAYLGGGPGTAIYRSFDGGENWEKLSKGLPTTNMGKIGLAISPQKSDVIYAAIELETRTGGIYRSENKGASWEKRSNTVSGATGPHYYQELYASPHQFDRIYLADVRMQVSDDGGKTFKQLKEDKKHSDNHSLTFKADDPNYLLVGTDGGIYESYDLAENWRYIANLSLTQFYKIAVDDAEPYYSIYGGTQDNSTQCGPSRTKDESGIRNADWQIILGADGHQPATEPGNPSIVYAEWQEGNLVRADRTTGEVVNIQPQPGEGEKNERFNWDSPILISPHSPTRLYYASQRVWVSNDRGDSWTAISGDLTKNQDRMHFPIMDKKWSWNSPWDISAMSEHNTITSLAESPKQEGLIYAGTDDGSIQVTEDGGKNWRKIDITNLPGVPATAFVNDIKADLFNANTVYVALDNHKFGDFNPYLFKSNDKGKTWILMKGNIPNRTLVWRLVQDHIKPELFFAATEFGIYFTVTSGEKWIKLTGKLPVISFRDLAIQRRENDLVAASFGRGIYILDDYSPLRNIQPETKDQEATLYQPRKAWWYVPTTVIGGDGGAMGADYFTSPNPPFGAVFTYQVHKEFKSLKAIRQEKEKELTKLNKDIPFPGWDSIEQERIHPEPKIWLTVKDINGNVVRRIEGPVTKGINRISWDLRYSANNAIRIEKSGGSERGRGSLVMPGKYTVSLFKQVDGQITELSGPFEFSVEPLRAGVLKGASYETTIAFRKEFELLKANVSAANVVLENSIKKVDAMQKALTLTPVVPGPLDEKLAEIKRSLQLLDIQFNGNQSKDLIGEKNIPTVSSRMGVAQSALTNSTYGPTPTHIKSLDLAAKQFVEIRLQLDKLINSDIPAVEKAMSQAGSPWIEGQPLR